MNRIDLIGGRQTCYYVETKIHVFLIVRMTKENHLPNLPNHLQMDGGIDAFIKMSTFFSLATSDFDGKWSRQAEIDNNNHLDVKPNNSGVTTNLSGI